MATLAEITSAADSIAAFYKPLKIILFGSYAYGMPTYDSDVDLLVLRNFRGSSNQQHDKIRSTIVMPFPIDLLVRTPAEVRRRIAWNDCFLAEIMERGSCFILPTTLEWVKKAEADYDAVLLLLKSRKGSRHDTICFHCQLTPARRSKSVADLERSPEHRWIFETVNANSRR